MSNAQISLGGRFYTLAVEAGEETRLREAAAVANEALEEVRAAAPQLDRDNQMVLAMMMLTDELVERRSQKASAKAAPSEATQAKAQELGVDVEQLISFHNKLAERIEQLLAK
jgi:cell division protein ZapA (FtsZ GTPase activity inhibitor)